MASPHPQRRWYQFSLRTMFVVMTFLCVGPGGYVAYEQNKARKGQAALVAIKKLGGVIQFDLYVEDEIPARSPLMKILLGDDQYAQADVVYLSREGADLITDRDLDHVAALPNLTDLELRSSRITDAGIARLASLKRLEYLGIDRSQITGDGLAHLTAFRKLEVLTLRQTNITDSGLVHLARLQNLNTLILYGTPVTDAGVAHLQSLPHLCGLVLVDTQVSEVGLMHVFKIESLTALSIDEEAVTEEGAQRLETARPDVDITYRPAADHKASWTRKRQSKELR